MPTALAPLAARVAELARVRAVRHTIIVDVPADLRAQAAPDRLEQVLTNLMDNALKYSPEGGTDHVSAAASDGTVRLVVADAGVGIPANRQAELFRPFVRIEQALTRQTEGAGLGLYILRTA